MRHTFKVHYLLIKITMKTLLSLLLTLVFSSSHAGYNEGIDAFSKGDHKTAIYQFEKALNLTGFIPPLFDKESAV